jgi:hypothetical protein
VYLTVLVLQLISTSVFSVLCAVFLLLGQCTCSCVRSILVLSRVHDCTYVPVFTRVDGYVFVSVLARMHDTSVLLPVHPYLLVCALVPTRMFHCT